MESSAKIFSVMVFCLIVMVHQTSANESRGKELIKKACSMSPSKELCEEVLASDPVISPNADLKDLAIISLRVAANNASAILNYAKTFIDNPNLDPDIQQSLADCKENILDAESQLEDTIAALLTDSETDAQVWLKAALAAIDTCDDSIPGNDDVLSVQSAHFRKLCNIAVAINGLLIKNNF